MDSVNLYLLLVIALGIGYLLGICKGQGKASSSSTKKYRNIDTTYIRGLNYLLNEDADAAVDTFTEHLPVNSGTLETHLSLGALLRRRGEVGRAIRLHEGLLKHRGLLTTELQKIQFELALDFFKAGVLDRAEELFTGLRYARDPELGNKSLMSLVEIYRDEKEWMQAIETIDQLMPRLLEAERSRWRTMQAHFYCENAQQELLAGRRVGAQKLLAKAVNSDTNCVRANLLLAELEIDNSQWRQALVYLKQVPNQDPDFIPEILPQLLNCYLAEGDSEGLIEYLNALQDEFPSSSVLISLAEQVKQHESESAALSLLNQKLASRPSLRVVGKLLDFQRSRKSKEEQPAEQDFIQSLLDSLLAQQSYYQCESCGFSGNQLHWQCPSCKSWGRVKAVKGIEGE